jgi:dTDP-4-amino-4,6-dideoxygalactose transaminase
MIITYCVRAGFDLCLQALEFPEGSEIVMSALTIREMADIVRKNGLVPVPLDLELETLAPAISTVESAVTLKTRAIVVAHLFGTRVPMDPIVELAKRNNLFVIEDCAQAFAGREYTGHPQGDLAMFSFGSIKTSTALGGALARGKDPQFLHKMRAIQASYPLQSRDEHLKAVSTHVCVKLFTIPMIYGLFYRACAAMEKDFDQVINAVHGLPD